MATQNQSGSNQISYLTKFEDANLPEPSDLPPFVVLELNRYYPEPRFRKRYGLDTCRFWDSFDITLSDKVCKMKFVLTPNAIFKKKVFPGCVVSLTKFSRYWSEESLSKEVIVVIHELEVVQKEPMENIAVYMDLPWSGTSSKQKENVPLASARCYYMDNWTNNVITKNLDYQAEHCDISSVATTEISSIKNVVTKRVSQYSKPALLVKVMRKSRLLHHINQNKDDKWPLQLPLVVADCTGWCDVVLWNKLAPQLLNQIQEGTLLFLKNFRVKSSIQQQRKSYFSPPQGTTVFPYELSLDSQRPESVIKIVTYGSQDDIRSLNFPPLEFCFMTRKDLISVPDWSVVDVAGLVTYVGRVEREPIHGSGSLQDDSGAFYYRRWIHLRDTSLPDPIIALVYSGEQKDTFLSLKPGEYMLCRHMGTNQHLDDLTSSRQNRHMWLTTTANSWLYVFKNHSCMENIPELAADLVEANIVRNPADYTAHFMEGGFFRYPPFPLSLEALQKWCFKQSNNSKLGALQIIPSDQWKEVFGRMTWRECHQLAVHASFLSITFSEVVKEQARVLRCSPRKKICLDSNINRRASRNLNEIDANHLGSIKSDDISELWPLILSEKSPKKNCALLVQWQGMNDQVILNTVKPCALNTADNINSLVNLVSGMYDSDRGFTDSVRTKLTRGEIKILTDSAQSLVNSKFFLLLDVYTNSDSRQLVVLNRAFQM